MKVYNLPVQESWFTSSLVKKLDFTWRATRQGKLAIGKEWAYERVDNPFLDAVASSGSRNTAASQTESNAPTGGITHRLVSFWRVHNLSWPRTKGQRWESIRGALVERDSYRCLCFCSLERRPRDISCFVFHFRGGQCTFIDGWIEALIRPGHCRFECSPRLRQLDFIPFHRSPPLSLTAIAKPNIVIMSHWSQFAGKFSDTLLSSARPIVCYRVTITYYCC